VNWLNTTQRGYIFDRRIIWGMFSFVLLLVFYALAINNFDITSTNFYFECKNDECPNPMAKMDNCKTEVKFLFIIPLYSTKDCREGCDWCYKETVSRGVYGKKLKGEFIYQNSFMITIFLLVVSLVGNHFIHNKGKKIDIEIPLSKNKKISLAKWFEDNKGKKDNDI